MCRLCKKKIGVKMETKGKVKRFLDKKGLTNYKRKKREDVHGIKGNVSFICLNVMLVLYV